MKNNLSIIVAIVSGLFALLGGFFGAWLARRTEYEKWLRKERSVAFAEFLKQAHSVREKATDILYNSGLSERERDLKITELFIRLNAQENIVRLYLKANDRESFSKLKHELWIFLSPTTRQTIRINNVDEVFSKIQEIFERTIHG